VTSSTYGQVRAYVRRLEGPGGAMPDTVRLDRMQSLLTAIARSARYDGGVDSTQLVRLAAHAVAWAEAVEGRVEREGRLL
jgi:hypothetical protein